MSPRTARTAGGMADTNGRGDMAEPTKRCSVEGCGRKHLARGLCDRHYRRFHARGDLEEYAAPRERPRRAAVCTVEGCALPHKARGLCPKHYNRWAKYGDTSDAVLRPKRANGTGCLSVSGYIVIKIDGRSYPQHRLVMERVLGRPVRPFESVHHKNGIRHDNRPENLEIWTKPGHGAGQRPEDLVTWVVAHYPELVQAILDERNQLRLAI